MIIGHLYIMLLADSINLYYIYMILTQTGKNLQILNAFFDFIFSESTITYIKFLCYQLTKLRPRTTFFPPEYPSRIPWNNSQTYLGNRQSFERHWQKYHQGQNDPFVITVDQNTLAFPGLICNRRLTIWQTMKHHRIEWLMELHWPPLRFRITLKLCVASTTARGLKTWLRWSFPSRPYPVENVSVQKVHWSMTFAARLKFTEHSFAVSGLTAWNSLPLELKQINNSLKFKKLLKSHLFLLPYSELFWLFDYCATFGHL